MGQLAGTDHATPVLLAADAGGRSDPGRVRHIAHVTLVFGCGVIAWAIGAAVLWSLIEFALWMWLPIW